MDERPYKCHCGKAFRFPGGLASHKYKLHRGEKQPQTGKGIDTVRIYPNGGEKTDNEFVNDHLDNNKDMYDEEEWKNLKRKASGSEAHKRPKRDKSPTRIKCRLCSASFLDARELARHNEEQHPMCVHCRRRFTDRNEFDKHHHPTCPMCNKVFIFEKDLNEHLLQHPKCPRCGETFMSEYKLRQHIIRDHQGRDRSRSPAPQRDLEDVPSSQMQRCPICLKKFEQRYLERHIRQHRQDESESGLGESDDQSDAAELPEALSDASSLSLDRHNVPLPDSSLSDASSTRKDLEVPDGSHSDASTATAGQELVPFRRARSYELSDDHSSVKSIDDELFKCPDCHRKFPSQKILDKHYQDKHIKKRHKHHLPCHFCGERFPSRQLLDEHIEMIHPQPSASHLPKPSKDVYECEICKDILKTKEGYIQHMKNHRQYNCKVCAAQFTSTADRDIHMSMNHPKCMLCDRVFATTDEYLRHKLREHPEDRTYDGPDLPSEEEDDLDSDEDSIDAEDRQFHKHINCVTIEKFLQINDLIKENRFETLVGDEELLEALQIIFKGAIKGYIPLCSPQRLVLTKSMKKLMFSFGTRPSGSLLMRNKKNLKQLFKILWASVDGVIKAYMKYT